MQAEYAKLDIGGKHVREFLLRMVYCAMLGFDVSSFNILAIKMT